ncbi:MAG: hypothetical protein JEZ06_12115 [Anaerolineaceae bacterium]|nr:hypothetical protein [Anaerolineaceae bacterium]
MENSAVKNDQINTKLFRELPVESLLFFLTFPTGGFYVSVMTERKIDK